MTSLIVNVLKLEYLRVLEGLLKVSFSFFNYYMLFWGIPSLFQTFPQVFFCPKRFINSNFYLEISFASSFLPIIFRFPLNFKFYFNFIFFQFDSQKSICIFLSIDSPLPKHVYHHVIFQNLNVLQFTTQSSISFLV